MIDFFGKATNRDKESIGPFIELWDWKFEGSRLEISSNVDWRVCDFRLLIGKLDFHEN